MPDRDDEREVARFYTRSRRFPKFIGRLHDGTKIPGGPYTLTQGVVLAIVLVVALLTQQVWGTGSPIVNIPAAGLMAWGAAWGAGKIPATRRNLMSVIAGGMSAMTRPAAGRYRGSTIRLRPPHRAGGRVTIDIPSVHSQRPAGAEELVPEPTPASAAEPIVPQQPTAPTPALSPTHAVSGVERLLQQARGGN